MANSPNVWLVSPAWQRFDVSGFVFAQRARLVTELTARGIDANCVIVADDENIDIARSFGFDVVEMENRFLGAKVNAGMKYACTVGGATHIVACGSDDWIHSDFFNELPKLPYVQTRERIALVDLHSGELALINYGSREHGIIPWIVPSRMLKPCGYQPIPPEKMQGMDAWLIRGITGWHRGERRPSLRQDLRWTAYDPHPFCAVDFKSRTNITPYEALADNPYVSKRVREAWPQLRLYYPDDLVDLAYQVHLTTPPPDPRPRRRRRRQ